MRRVLCRIAFVAAASMTIIAKIERTDQGEQLILPGAEQGCPGKIWSHAKLVLVSYRTMQQSSWTGLSDDQVRPSTSFDARMRRRGCADQVRARRLQIASYQDKTFRGCQSTFPGQPCGAERSAWQAAAARGAKMRPRKPQLPPGGLFEAPEPEERCSEARRRFRGSVGGSARLGIGFLKTDVFVYQGCHRGACHAHGSNKVLSRRSYSTVSRVELPRVSVTK
jgi:hypothetical protein